MLNQTVESSCTPTPSKVTDTRPELNFFRSLNGTLEIELTVPAKLSARTHNRRASPEAQISNLRLDAAVFNPKSHEFRDMTPEELDSVAFYGNRIKLRGLSGDVVSHDAPNGAFFTVRELLHAVEETERQTRDQSKWLGGVDVQHCFFEGIYLAPDGVWDIVWGS
jgi:hypothetical protein